MKSHDSGPKRATKITTSVQINDCQEVIHLAVRATEIRAMTMSSSAATNVTDHAMSYAAGRSGLSASSAMPRLYSAMVAPSMGHDATLCSSAETEEVRESREGSSLGVSGLSPDQERR